jgi:glycosyltransferase involved in cell wall biosynthesis
MANAGSPLVSVLVPTFNRQQYLRETITSVLAQTFGDFEVIVHDNASSIDPVDIVTSFGDPRIRYFRHASNLGMTANVLSALDHARGKYIAILSDDDLWHPGFLAALIPPLEAQESLALTYCDHVIIDEAGREDEAMTEIVTRRWQRHRLREGPYQPFDEIALVFRSICVFSGAVLRRSAIDWDCIPRDMSYGLDLYLAYLAARTGKACYYVAQRLTQLRYHANSAGSGLSRQLDRRIINARNAMFYWEQILRDHAILRHKHYFEMKLGYNALVIVLSLMRAGDWRLALRELRHYWSAGLIRPQSVVFHLIYAVWLRRLVA